MNSRVSITGLLFVVLALMFVPLRAYADEGIDGSGRGPFVSQTEGDVQVKIFGSASWKPAGEGFVLGPGDMVKTGSGSRMEISHYSGTIRLYENTVLTVPSILSRGGKRDLHKVILEDGTGLFRLDSERLKGEFKVRTRHIVAGVKGTTFAVKTDEQSSKVAVYEGRVQVHEAGKPDRDGMEIEKGISIEAVNGKGLGQVEKFKPRDDWTGWKKSREPQLDGKTSGRKNEEKVKGAWKNKSDMNSVSTEDNPKAKSFGYSGKR